MVGRLNLLWFRAALRVVDYVGSFLKGFCLDPVVLGDSRTVFFAVRLRDYCTTAE